MAKDLLENATHLNNFKGRWEARTTAPTDNGVAGLKTGRLFYRTDTNNFCVFTSTTIVKSAQFTTTSTSTS